MLKLSTALVIFLMTSAYASKSALPAAAQPVVRLAELEIEPSQLDRYTQYLREEIETSIKVADAESVAVG